jgi:hypothetical protein
MVIACTLTPKRAALQFTDVTEVAPHEAMSLRAARPIGAAVVRWEACGSRLAALVKGEPVERIWRNLSGLPGDGVY